MNLFLIRINLFSENVCITKSYFPICLIQKFALRDPKILKTKLKLQTHVSNFINFINLKKKKQNIIKKETINSTVKRTRAKNI